MTSNRELPDKIPTGQPGPTQPAPQNLPIGTPERHRRNREIVNKLFPHGPLPDCDYASVENWLLSRDQPMHNKESFLKLWQQWQQDTIICSFVNTAHPAWAQMSAFGKLALPWIFELLVADRHYGLCALISEITGERPKMRPADYGKVDPVTRAYIAWGREHGYLGAERRLIPE